MLEVIFNYENLETVIKSDKNSKIKDIFNDFAYKNKININNTYLVYNSKEINLNLSFKELISQKDKLNNRIIIYVFKQNDTKENELKKVICPKCGEPIKDDSVLIKCKNNHDIKNEMNILRKNLDNLKKNVNEIMNIFNGVIEYVENFYELNNSNIMSNSPKYNIVKETNIIKYTYQIINNRKINLDDIINIYNKINSAITIKYKLEENQKIINIFGSDFVKENKRNCKIICNDKTYQLTENFDIIDYKCKEKDILEIKLTGINNISSMESMFCRCNSLLSIPDINKWDTVKVNNMSKLFFGCTSLVALPDISTFNTINVEHIGNMFSSCNSLISLPDISKWNISKVIHINGLFSGCSKLLYLPDISKWDTSSAVNMQDMFFGCNSLLSLPDISKWNISNAKDISYMFRECYSLLSLPDISKWNTVNVTNISDMFYRCRSLSSFPDISKWNTMNLKNMSCLFFECISLTSLPDITKWDASHVTNISFLFYKCVSLSSVPDISKFKLPKSCFWSNLNENDINIVQIPYHFPY